LALIYPHIDIVSNICYNTLLDKWHYRYKIKTGDVIQGVEMSPNSSLGSPKGRTPLTPLQEKFVKSGFEGFDDQDTIELLLSLVLPPRHCRQLAKECIERFKNLRGLFSASTQELQGAGVTVPCMFCIKLLHELPAEVLRERIIEQPVHSSPKEVFDYLYYSMRDLTKEVFKAIYLNNRNQIIDTADLFEGTLDSLPIRPREIVESAIEHKAAALIFVHNHPTGDPTPSRSDKQLTRDLVFVGNIIQIKVLDHIIIGENRYFSFADEGLIQKYNDDFMNIRIRRLDDGAKERLNYSFHSIELINDPLIPN